MEEQAHVIKTRSYILRVIGQLVTQVFLQDNNNTKHAGVSKIAIFDTPA